MGRDKALVPVDGVAMVARVAAALRAAGCDPVVAIGGDRAALGALGLTVVPDRYPGEGPLGGVLTALDHHPDHDMVVVTACDLPLLSPASVAAVVAGLAAPGRGAQVAMARTDRLQPLCAAWRPSAATVLAEAFHAGERRLHVAARDLELVEVDVDAAELSNVNTTGDLPQ
jgi:molybdopterin-guanine dinucleotide biosynthesis protein A